MRYRLYTLFIFLAALSFAACSKDNDANTASDPNKDNNSNIKLDDSYQYTLPVVFHVIYKDEQDPNQKIPASRFKDLISYLNRIYEGGHYGKSTNTRITFTLAETNEQGKSMSTPGVDYVKWNGSWPIDCESFMDGNISGTGSLMWDPNKYINVYFYHFKDTDDGTILGITHLPYTYDDNTKLVGLETVRASSFSKNNIAFPYGASINSQYAWKDSDGYFYQSSKYTDGIVNGYNVLTDDIIVTLAHELGHYLGLYHVFADDNEDVLDIEEVSSDPDYCSDTPSYDRAAYMTWLNQYVSSVKDGNYNLELMLQRTDPDGKTFSSENIMDYEVTLGFLISQNQQERMRHVLYYSPLLPGPKMNAATRSTAAASTEKLKPHYVICKQPR